jgi:hypothetical protein
MRFAYRGDVRQPGWRTFSGRFGKCWTKCPVTPGLLPEVSENAIKSAFSGINDD